jgi:hypothetical protein
LANGGEGLGESGKRSFERNLFIENDTNPSFHFQPATKTTTFVSDFIASITGGGCRSPTAGAAELAMLSMDSLHAMSFRPNAKSALASGSQVLGSSS